MQLHAQFHWVQYGPQLIKTETVDNRLDIRLLTQQDGAFVSVPHHLDSKQPVELAQIGDLNVLPDVALKLINFIQGLGSDGAIVNVDNDNNELTGHPASEVNGLVNRTLGKTQLINKDLYQPLVPMAPTLLQTIQGLLEMIDLVHQGNFNGKIIHYNHQKGVDNDRYGIITHCQPPFGDYNGLSFYQNFPDVGVINGFEARGLAHVYHFIVGECAVEIRAFDINLMEL